MAKLGNVRVGGNNPVKIMGIINTSRESFYKNSIKTTKQDISNTIKQMELDGADIVDIGGMSTAPYLSTLVSEKIELDRITKAIKIIQNVSNLPIDPPHQIDSGTSMTVQTPRSRTAVCPQ